MRKKIVLFVAIVCGLVFGAGSALFVPGKAKAEAAAALSGILAYDDTELTVTENYSAIVGATTSMATNGSFNGAGRVVAKLGTMTEQLDNGKKGMLVSSKKSGNAADGSSLSFKSKLNGDFSIDFRVFSRASFYGFNATDVKSDKSTSDDRYNSFLDLKRVDIVITSATNADKEFTISVHGAARWDNSTPFATVGIKGETYKNGEYSGYGLTIDRDAVYPGYGTNLQGSSFCNSTTVGINNSTTLSVDMSTLKSYATVYSTERVSDTLAVTEQKKLIRDLHSNTNTGNQAIVGSGLSSLDKEDFENGYYVKIVFADVTDNATPVKTLAWNQNGNDYFSNTVESADDTLSTYDRYANMLIYSLNGQSFEKQAGFDVQSPSFIGDDYKWSDGTNVNSGYYLIANETGLNAEGATFDYKNVYTDSFEQEFICNTFVANTLRPENCTVSSKFYGGTGATDDGAYPFVDVKEVAFDFASKVDPSKKFTLYVRTVTGTWGQMYVPSARVHIAGDRICTNDFEYGYGLNTGLKNWASSKPEGSFDPQLSSKLDGWIGNFWAGTTGTNNKISVKFDPDEMKVYGISGGEYKLIRDLSENSGDGVPVDYCASLSSDDFKDGYTVSFRFADVVRNGFIGYDNSERVNSGGAVGGSILQITAEDASERRARVILRSVTEPDLELDKSADLTYSVKRDNVRTAKTVKGELCDVTPLFYDVFTSDAVVGGKIELEFDGEEISVGKNKDGKYYFKPLKYGQYKMTFTANNSYGEWASGCLFEPFDVVKPVASLKNGIKTEYVIGSFDETFLDDDLLYFDDSGECDVTITISQLGNTLDYAYVSEKEGVYTVNYTVADGDGNSVELKRNISIIGTDKIAPTVIVDGKDSVVPKNTRITVPGYSARDNYDGNVKCEVSLYYGDELLGNNVKSFVACRNGRYTIRYTAVDSAGNKTVKDIVVTTFVKPISTVLTISIVAVGVLACVGIVLTIVLCRRKRNKSDV